MGLRFLSLIITCLVTAVCTPGRCTRGRGRRSEHRLDQRHRHRRVWGARPRRDGDHRSQREAGTDGRDDCRRPIQRRRVVGRRHTACPGKWFCRARHAAQSCGIDMAHRAAAATADRIGHRHRVARRDRRRHGGQRVDRIVGRAPHVCGRRRRRCASEYPGVQSLPPLLVSRREPNHARCDAPRRFWLGREPDAGGRRRLGAQRSIWQLGVLEPHPARGGRSHRGCARRRRRSLRRGRARRRHSGADARRSAAAAPWAFRSRIARNVPRLGFWRPELGQVVVDWRNRGAKHRRHLHRRRRRPRRRRRARVQRLRLGFWRGWLRRRDLARHDAGEFRQRESRQWHADPGQRHRLASVCRRRQRVVGRRLLDGAHHWWQPGLFSDVFRGGPRSSDRAPDQRSNNPRRLHHRWRPVDADVESG